MDAARQKDRDWECGGYRAGAEVMENANTRYEFPMTNFQFPLNDTNINNQTGTILDDGV
jgi:hypothetical protein